MKLLFLDFDGVTHDADATQIEYVGNSIEITGAGLFLHVPLLAEILVPARIPVVISSSWMNHFPLEELKARLGPLGSLVIGTTSRARTLQPKCRTRFDECDAIASHVGVGDWLLLDDQPAIVFGPTPATPEQAEHVVWCDSTLGLTTPGVLDRLRRWALPIPVDCRDRVLAKINR